ARRQIGILRGHEGELNDAEFSPDGRRVVTASYDRTARIYRTFLSINELIEEAKQAVPRCLTRERREEAFLAPEPPEWCITLGKSPYHTEEWPRWLADRKAGEEVAMPAEEARLEDHGGGPAEPLAGSLPPGSGLHPFLS